MVDDQIGCLGSDGQFLNSYVASDDLCYNLGVHCTADKALSQSFWSDTDTVRLCGSEALFVIVISLINSKVYSDLPRKGPDVVQKEDNDGHDIVCILGYIQRAGIRESVE